MVRKAVTNNAITRNRFFAILVVAAVALAFSPISALSAHAAGLAFAPGTPTEFTTYSISPKAEVTYTQSTGESVYVDKLIGGTWADPATATWSQVGYKYGQQNGTVNVMGDNTIAAGTYTYRLRLGNINSPSEAIGPITVTVQKNQTTFDVGALSVGGTLVNKGYRNITNTVYYECEKDVTVSYAGASGFPVVHLERNDGGVWTDIAQRSVYASATSTSSTLTCTIRQATVAPTSYRLHVEGTEHVTGGYSQEFVVSGPKAAPGLIVKYNKTKQAYKKGGVKLDISIADNGAFEGKAYVYDGKKKLATLSVRSGYIKGKSVYYSKGNKYALPKNLKKGTHKKYVKFVPSKDYGAFYNTQKSATKKIKVK
ncbi:MAG: hypothetical protein LBG82_02555 [Clostridiales Family XIII bacterium]|jgi:hypothetical protein|nr:hypothetical protein [Clostridiales Family XIII bacterium]